MRKTLRWLQVLPIGAAAPIAASRRFPVSRPDTAGLGKTRAVHHDALAPGKSDGMQASANLKVMLNAFRKAEQSLVNDNVRKPADACAETCSSCADGC